MEFYKNLGTAMEHLTKRGAFLTAKGEKGSNTMSIAWGYVGFSWGKPYFVAMVRPQRYTQEFMESGKDFTISIPYSDEMKQAIKICGTKSGREIDKEKEANIKFVPSNNVESPIVDDCNMYYECKTTYVERLNEDKLPEEIREKIYPADDYHYMYYGEIVDCYEK